MMNHKKFLEELKGDMDDEDFEIVEIRAIQNIPTIYVKPEDFIEYYDDCNDIYLLKGENKYVYYTLINESGIFGCVSFDNITDIRIKSLDEIGAMSIDPAIKREVETLKEHSMSAQEEIDRILGKSR